MASTPSALEGAWDTLIELYGEYPRAIFVCGTFIIHTVVFWGLNGALWALRNAGLGERWRINQGKAPPPELVSQCIKALLIDHFVTGTVGLWIISFAFEWAGCWSDAATPWPSGLTVLWQLAVFTLVNDAAFYWAHRMLHTTTLYKMIHKQHHKFNVSIGIAAEFAHPVEHILANQIPTALGPILVGPHLSVWFLWLALRLWETIDAHCGYDFPFSPFKLMPFFGGAEQHDFHHKMNVGNYGMLTFWDRAMGTDRAFLRWKERKEAKEAKVRSGAGDAGGQAGPAAAAAAAAAVKKSH